MGHQPPHLPVEHGGRVQLQHAQKAGLDFGVERTWSRMCASKTGRCEI
jgi:hypothetical protein